MRRLLILGVLALGVALLAPLAASARIVPQKGVGIVRIGAVEGPITDRLPPPTSLVRTQSPSAGLSTTIWTYNGLELHFEGGNRVTRIVTTRVWERTKKGAGIHTRKGLLRKLHPKLRCAKGKTSKCRFGNPKKGQGRLTTFDLEDGVVTSVTISRRPPALDSA